MEEDILKKENLKQIVREIGNNLAENLPGKYDDTDFHKLKTLFYNCFINTAETTVQFPINDLPFVITGDIPAMWLRDSAAQVKHYIPYINQYKVLSEFVKGLILRQFTCINKDPYANSYNISPNSAGHKDKTDKSPWDWERKYEVDSLCYAIKLLNEYYNETKDETIFNNEVIKGLYTIVDLWILEQNHDNSHYTFVREDCIESDTIPCGGKGNPIAYTGMTWSGFRPSDDSCIYGYFIPANMFAVVVLGYVEKFAKEILNNTELLNKAVKLRSEIIYGINEYGIVEHKEFGKIYAYETDGLGNYNLMDDANTPSLLSIPYLGFQCSEEIYKNTRRFILSKENPYYYEGEKAKGLGSPHTPEQYIWHIALSMQGLTSTDKKEQLCLLKTILATDAGKGFLHEGFHVNDPYKYTRDWFAWSNSIFAEFVCKMLEEGTI